MRLKCSFETVNMDSEIIAVPVGEGASKIKGVVKLNKSGAEIFEMLRNDITEEQIISNIKEKYDDDIQTITNYVHYVVDAIRNAGLIIP